MIFQALLLVSALQGIVAQVIPCPEQYKHSIKEVGCSSGLLVFTALTGECVPILSCDESTKILTIAAEPSEKSYNDAFLCCPDNLDAILQSPQTKEDCVTKCNLENGMASHEATWLDGTCTCSLSAFGQCNPFGEVAEGYSTCEKYFQKFGDYNCNYNLKSHQVCANDDFDYDGEYVQIRDLCPDQCATVAFEQDSLDETVTFDIETGEAVAMSNDRRQLSGYPFGSHIGKPIGAIVYEHVNGQGRGWTVSTRGKCCKTVWRWCCGFVCEDNCRQSGNQDFANGSNNVVSSVTVGPGCKLTMYQHGAGIHAMMGRWKIYHNRFGDNNLNTNVAYGQNDDASSFLLACWW